MTIFQPYHIKRMVIEAEEIFLQEITTPKLLAERLLQEIYPRPAYIDKTGPVLFYGDNDIAYLIKAIETNLSDMEWYNNSN